MARNLLVASQQLLRLADDTVMQLPLSKRKRQSVPVYIEHEGKKLPNPESQEGRKALIRDIANKGISLKTRALLIEKFVGRALDAQDRADFKEQLEQLADNIVKLNKQDAPELAQALMSAYEVYKEVRSIQTEGRQSIASGRSALASYKRRHGLR